MKKPLVAWVAPVLIALSLAPSLARKKQEQPAELSAQAILAHIRYLASDELQGRGTGTPGAEKAARYIADHFRASGLKPLGDRGSFLQWFEVTIGAKVGRKNSLTITPPVRPAKLEVRNDFLPVPMSATGAVTAGVVFVGYGIEATELKYNDYADLDVKGKVALIMRHSPEGTNPHGQFQPYEALRYKVMTARDQGAKAALVCVGPLSPGEIEELGPWTTGQGVADSGIPVLFVKRDVAAGLVKAAGRDLKTVQQEINEKKQPQSFAIGGVMVTLSAEVVKEKKKTANVIGYLPGNDGVEKGDTARKRETIAIGAHYDHLGLGEQPGSLAQQPKGQIHHGADDNASGTAGVLELARYFTARRGQPKRSLLFMGFSGEEMGLLGSKHFVEHPTLPLDRIAAMINLDMVGRLKNDRVIVLGEGTSPFWKEALENAKEAIGALQLSTSSGGSAFGASDQQSFYLKSIPVLFFYTGQHEDYHKPSDTWDRINAEGEARILRLIARVAEQAQTADRPLPFVKVAEPAQMRGGFRVRLGTVPDYTAQVEGVRLDAVRDNSPAARAGVKAGDIIVALAGKTVRSVEEYVQVLGLLQPGKPVEMVVLRGKEHVSLTVTPDAG